MEFVKLEKPSTHKLKYTYIIEKIPDAFSSELFRNYAICKIGHSKNPENRVKKLQTGNDCKLKLVNFVPLLRFEKPLRDHYISIAHYIREGEWVALLKSDYESLIYLFENFFNETIRLNFGVACLNIPNKKLIPMCLGAQGLSEYNQRMLDTFEEKLKIELTIPNIYVLVAELLFDKCWLIENKTEPQNQKVEETKMENFNIENNNNEMNNYSAIAEKSEDFENFVDTMVSFDSISVNIQKRKEKQLGNIEEKEFFELMEIFYNSFYVPTKLFQFKTSEFHNTVALIFFGKSNLVSDETKFVEDFLRKKGHGKGQSGSDYYHHLAPKFFDYSSDDCLKCFSKTKSLVSAGMKKLRTKRNN